ncbi:MAG: universal stress protein [Acidobacteriota bacterium]|nr:universal stress protein [Acidobacteriota bacterium]
MILIAYDGSDDAKAAIEQASKLFPGETVTVVTVWQRFIDTMARVGGGINLVVDYDEIDTDAEKAAQTRAEQGAALAKEAGLDATARTAVVESSTADAILATAAAVDATVVVCGSRGYTGVKSLMLGSVSHHILQHADLPVVVVPSPAVARARAEHRASLR